MLREALTAGLLVKNGSSRGEPQARCNACGGSVTLSYGTAYYGLETDRGAVRDGGAGVGGRQCATGHGADRAGGQRYGLRLAGSGRTPLPYGHALLVAPPPLTECQLDELWSFVHTKEVHLPGAKLYLRDLRRRLGMDRVCASVALVLAFVIGKRDQASADLLLARVRTCNG